MAGAQKPAAIRIRLPFHTVEEFTEGYRHHLSRAAVFVATETQRPVGTILQFEFVLLAGEPVLRGEAVVAKEARPISRPGMVLRFLSLDERTRHLVDRICPPLAKTADPLVLGIDFGNRTLRAAVARRGKPEALALGREKTIPSAVGVDEHGRIVVGQAALTLTIAHPERVVVGPKRLLGRRPSESGKLLARLAFKTGTDARGELSAQLGGQELAMTRLAAELLRAVREQAQEALGVPVQRAVIAVPPHFGDRQRSALRRAAQEAGLSVDQLVNDTTAIALTCGIGAALPRRRLALVDLGGGSFNCSVVQIEGDEIDTLASGGDSLFGGAEFDSRLANWLAEKFESESGISVVDDPAAFERLQDSAARVKVALSEKVEAEVNLPFLAQREGEPVSFRTTVTRADFESLTADLVERVVHLTSEVLTAGKLEPRACDELVLLGGMSAMPLLRAKLTALFGKEPRREIDGQGAVARGAAILGHSLTQREQGLGLREVLSAALFVELPSGELSQVFERHAVLPVDRHLALDAAPAGCRVRIHQGAKGQTEVLGVLEVEAGEGRPQLALTLSVDGILHARLKLGDHERSLEITPADARGELPLAVIEGLEGDPGEKKPSFVGRLFKGAGV